MARPLALHRPPSVLVPLPPPRPPNLLAAATPADADAWLHAFLRLSVRAESSDRLLRLALSQGPLSAVGLRTHLPRTWRLATAGPPITHDTQVVLTSSQPAAFAWPLDLTHGPNALAHVATFVGAILDEVAEQNGVTGWGCEGVTDGP